MESLLSGFVPVLVVIVIIGVLGGPIVKKEYDKYKAKKEANKEEK